VVTHGVQRLEFEMLDVAETGDPLRAPKIPRDYQPGGVPRV
jgi:hypothetical protein